ncbi:MAG: tail fiber domain-containing protein [Bacteroidales bacterium]|nr:tail fiber domain-containing protein [Bacteroidales bacterium]
MKKHAIIAIILLLSFNLAINAQIKLNSSGYVKIGSTESATQALDVRGNVIIKEAPGYSGYSYQVIFDHTGYYGTKCLHPVTNYSGNIGNSSNAFAQIWTYNLYNLSDERYKENVRDINDALDLITRLKGIRYNLIPENVADDSTLSEALLEKKKKEQKADRLGFIAQDVNKVIPEAVYYDDSTDIYGIDYTKIIPVLVEAIKEQQAIIKSLQSGSSSDKLKSTAGAGGQENPASEDVPLLYQNFPNPFTESTRIEYYLPDDIGSAVIFIYDMSGLQLKSVPVSGTGYGNVTINANELKAGMYMYTLIADGQVIDTKRMILTDQYVLSTK